MMQSRDGAIAALLKPFQGEVALIGIDKLLNCIAYLGMVEMA